MRSRCSEDTICEEYILAESVAQEGAGQEGHRGRTEGQQVHRPQDRARLRSQGRGQSGFKVQKSVFKKIAL